MEDWKRPRSRRPPAEEGHKGARSSTLGNVQAGRSRLRGSCGTSVGAAVHWEALDDADRLVTKPLGQAGRENVVGEELDEGTAALSRHRLCPGRDGAAEFAAPERLVHRHGMQLATPAPGHAADAGDDPMLVVADEGPATRRRSSPTPAAAIAAAAATVLLEQRQVGEIGGVLDDERERTVVHALGFPVAAAR